MGALYTQQKYGLVWYWIYLWYWIFVFTSSLFSQCFLLSLSLSLTYLKKCLTVTNNQYHTYWALASAPCVQVHPSNAVHLLVLVEIIHEHMQCCCCCCCSLINYFSYIHCIESSLCECFDFNRISSAHEYLFMWTYTQTIHTCTCI